MYNIDAYEIMTVGDWHGDLNYALMVLNRANKLGIKVIVHTGDFGLWDLNSDFIREVEDYLSKNSMILIFVDGNHEDHALINQLSMDEASGLNIVTNNIYHAPRGYRWTFNGAIWMALGGAASVDREWRTPEVDWFIDERITNEDVNYALRDGDVDVMVCHDAPFNISTLRMAYAGRSIWPIDDLALSNHSQKLVEKVMVAKNPKYLFHGHHHRDYSEDLYNTRVVGLNCNHPNMPIDKNYIITDNFGNKMI